MVFLKKELELEAGLRKESNGVYLRERLETLTMNCSFV